MAEANLPRRVELALTEIDVLATNLVADVKSLEARLERAGFGVAVLAYPELRIIEAGADCIRAEMREGRAAIAASAPVEQTPAERAAAMAESSAATFTRASTQPA